MLESVFATSYDSFAVCGLLRLMDCRPFGLSELRYIELSPVDTVWLLRGGINVKSLYITMTILHRLFIFKRSGNCI